MNEHALWHKAKSEVSYAYNQKTLHIVLRTAKNDAQSVSIVYGDPFEWHGKKPDFTWVHTVKKMVNTYQNRLYDYYFMEVEPPYLRTKYLFILTQGKKTYAYGSQRLFSIDSEQELYKQLDFSDFFNFPYINQEDLHQTPTWVKDTVWYQIFLDRFNQDSNESQINWGKLPVTNHEIYGGHLLGVIDKLPYLNALGITGIYFTPLFESPTAHKYDTTDYFKIDPQFGTNEDFKCLVDAAHALGIKVMLDGVFNHAGFNHPYFQDVILNGEKSIYKDCFYIKEYPVVNFKLGENQKPLNFNYQDLNYLTFAFTPMMPKWNTSAPLAEKHLLDCVTYWIKTYDIDGWRLDVSNEISHDFLRKIKAHSREAKPDTFILGENWDNATPWLGGDQLDSVMNYELSFPIWKYLEHNIDRATFVDLMVNYCALTPKNVMENMFNLVGSHDTVRIKRRLNDDPRRVKLAYLLMFLSAGAPNIYYGDEVGLTGDRDPDNRRCMLWDEKDQDLDFFDFVKTLITLRKTHFVFKDPYMKFIDAPMLVITKENNIETLLVLINNEPFNQTLELPLHLHADYINLINNQTVKLYDKINLESYDFLLLKRK
jgi:cyclomaltodextrinase / maltogenic alpha-amylase / neopullulanase